MDKDKKLMYDVWIDDILDEVRNNVVGEFWHPYFDTPFYKKVLKHLIQHSKFDNDDPVMGDRYDLYFKYNNYYRLENHSETDNYLHNYLGVEDKDINNILTLYAMILRHIFKTQGKENILTESNDNQKEFLDKVVDRLLKESEYRLWEDKHNYRTTLNHHEEHLKKIRVDIKFGLVNKWREDPMEYFDMKMVKDNLSKRRRKSEYLEDYEKEQLTNIYGLNFEEMEEVVFNYYTTFYKNIYKSYLEMNEDDKVPTSKPEEWFRGDEVFEIGGRLNEHNVEPFLSRITNQLLKETKYKIYRDGLVMILINYPHVDNPQGQVYSIREIDNMRDKTFRVGVAGVNYLRNMYGLTKSESVELLNTYYSTLFEDIWDSIVKNQDLDHYEDDDYDSDWISTNLNESLSSRVNKDVDDLFSKNKKLTNEKKIKSIFIDKYGMNKQDADQAMVIYLSKQQSLNESTEEPKGRKLKYLFKVADSIIKEIELDDYDIPGTKMRGYGPWNDNSTGHYGFWTGLEKHAKNTYGLTQAETEMVSGTVWDSLNSKNIYLSGYIHADEKTRKGLESLREQHYEEWDERAREQNINLLKAKGIDILSTDTNVPFFKRIDSKEIRFLKKVVNMLDKETKLEEADDLNDFIVYAPFGNYELKVLLNEYRHYGFEKYVNNMYAVGDNQIMFPTHNSIAQARESAFLWEMYKDKLRRKQIQMVNPGLPDIPDDAIITESTQDLSNDEHKSLLQSFEVMDTPEEIASEELGNMIKWVKTLPEELFLYRVLYLDDVNDINYDELGSHYSQDRTDLINNHYDRGSIYGDMGEHAYLITVKVPKSEVDVMETLNNNILYPHEKEITLKDKGRGAQYLDIEKI
jgi:hypothetical protein